MAFFNHDLMSKNHKDPALKILSWSISLIIFLVLALALGSFFLPKETNNSENSTQQNTAEKIPKWLGREFVIDSKDFDFLSQKEIAVWPSYSDQSQAIGKLLRGESIVLLGYDSVHNFCQVENKTASGWISCDWIFDIASWLSAS